MTSTAHGPAEVSADGLGLQTLDLLMDFQTKTCRWCSRTQQLKLWSVERGALAMHKQTTVE